MCSLVLSPFSRDFLKNVINIYSILTQPIITCSNLADIRSAWFLDGITSYTNTYRYQYRSTPINNPLYWIKYGILLRCICKIWKIFIDSHACCMYLHEAHKWEANMARGETDCYIRVFSGSSLVSIHFTLLLYHIFLFDPTTQRFQLMLYIYVYWFCLWHWCSMNTSYTR